MWWGLDDREAGSAPPVETMLSQATSGTAPATRRRKAGLLTGGAHSRRRARPRHRAIVRATVVVAVVFGLAIRTWLIFHAPINSDEAVVGLMAAAGLHGHFNAFYWGQTYGGTAETGLTTLFFAVFGQTVLAARLTVITLSAVAALLTWRIALRLVPSPGVAAMAGALVWAAPFASVSFSVLFYGFRGATLACGLIMLLGSLRILDGHRSPIEFAVLGLAAGVGWWSSPEIVYYVIPSGLLLLGAVVVTTGSRWRIWAPRGAVALVAIAVGALPWIWANLHTHFGSLNGARFNPLTRRMDYGDRFDSFFRSVFPTELGVRRGNDLAWIASGLGQPFVKMLTTVLVALVIVLVLLCLARPGRAMAIAAAVVAFPLVYALSPASTQFANGRYGVFLPPLLAMVVGIGLCEAARRLSGLASVRQPADGPVRTPAGGGRRSSGSAVVVAMTGIVLVSLLFSAVTFSQVTGQPHAFTQVWGNPDRASLEAVSTLEKAGVTTGYADYWVAYKLDFLSRSRLTITSIGRDVVRSAAIEDDVLHSKHPAWLFVPPGETDRGASQFSAPVLTIGPDGVPESSFVATLQYLHVRYRVIRTGVLNAVVPDRAVTPIEVNMPGAPTQASSSVAPRR